MWYHTIFVFVRLISLSIILSRSIHIVANGRFSFFFYGWIYSIVHICHIFFIHSSVDGHLSCFNILTILNRAAMKIGVYVLFKLVFSVFLDICPGVELQDHMVALFLVFLRNLHTVSIVTTPIYIPTNSVQGFPFLHTSSSIYYFTLFDDSHSDWCEVILHCGFDLYFSNN